MPSPSERLLRSLVKSKEDLEALLEKPRASTSGRNNLVNENVPGANLMYPPGSLTEEDREFTRLAKEVSETLKGYLR